MPTLCGVTFVLGCLVGCAEPSDRCKSDLNCNRGRLCVLGHCRPAGEAGLGGQSGSDGGRDGRTEAPSPDDAREDAGDADDGRRDGESSCGPDAEDCHWTPARLPGLVLWLDASLGVTAGSDGAVSRWLDRSGLGNHALQPASQLSPRLAPAGTNGRPLVAFGSPGGRQDIHMVIRDAPSLRWGRDPFAFVLVAISDNQLRNPGVLYRKRGPVTTASGLEVSAAGRGEGRLVVALRPDLVPYETIAYGITEGPPFAFAIRRSNSTTLELRVNGRRDGRVSGEEIDVDISASGADAVLGAGVDDMPMCCQLYGGIAEVVAVHGVLSDEDLASLEAYLRQKHALP
jgi:hypothetical protein